MKDRRGGRRSSQGNINREEEIGEGIGRVKAEIGKIERLREKKKKQGQK